MKKMIFFALILGFAFSSLSLSGVALAKHGKGHDKIHGQVHGNKSGIGVSNRETIKLYLKQNYGRKCPPGLAKKNNGCLPPGIAKKYIIGQQLPESVITNSLYPPGYGQKYVQVDKDVLLIEQASRKVIDAVTLLSAVGN
jgi:hypothetical protein